MLNKRYLLFIALINILIFGLLCTTLFFTSIEASHRATIQLTPTPLATPTPPPTPTVTPSSFSASMEITIDKEEVVLGETISATIDIEVSPGCIYPIIDIELSQSGEIGEIFSYTEPMTDTVDVPRLPLTYLLTAEDVGSVLFSATSFGERYCNDYWSWQYLSAESAEITVIKPGPDVLFIPFVEHSPQ